MSKHIKPPPRADQTDPEAAEPPRRASRFDERGIALQTIIIMVVLLAIAGAVAAVLFNRASTETERLERTEVQFDYSKITNEQLCKNASPAGDWTDPVYNNDGTLKTAGICAAPS